MNNYSAQGTVRKGETQSVSLRPMNNTTETIRIRVHGVDGSIRTFTQRGGGVIRQTLDWFHPTYLFAQQRIEIPGERSLTTFIASQVTRIDLVTEPRSNCHVPPDLVAAVELTEPAFQVLTQGEQPQEKPEESTLPHKTEKVLLDIALAGCQHVFLAQERAVSQPSQDMLRFSTLLTSKSLSFLMRTGGVAVLNIANLVCFTVYPDPAPVPAAVRATVRPREATELANPQRESGLPEIGEWEAA
jgi:hypothetical protein